jgi:hypothetical protein
VTPTPGQPKPAALPWALPKSQADWQALVTQLQSWMAQPQWLSPTLQGNWTYYGTPYSEPGFYQDFSGRVWLRGLLGVNPTPGTSTQAPPSTIFTLPQGYWPQYEQLLGATCGDGATQLQARLDITTSGNVVFESLNSGSAVTFLSLDGLSFSVLP